jgi:hypothetical protein
MLLLATLSLSPVLAAAAGRLGVVCSFSQGGCTVSVDGEAWGQGAGGGSNVTVTVTRAGGKTCSSADGSLSPRRAAQQLSGADALGTYTGASLLWSCGGVPFETGARVYSDMAGGGEALIFSQTWPEGAQSTALGPPRVPCKPGATSSPPSACPQEQVLSVFPAFSPSAAAAEAGAAQEHYMVVYNQMVGGMAEGSEYGAWDSSTSDVKSGTMGGPMVFFGGRASASGLVLTPITHAMEQNLHWEEGRGGGTLQAGLLGSIAQIPANYTAETMLFLGAREAEACAPFPVGTNCAVRGWGSALRRYKGKDTGFPAGGTAR